MDRRLTVEHCQPTSVDALFVMVQALWQKTAAKTTRALVASLPRRIAEVIKNEGEATSFN